MKTMAVSIWVTRPKEIRPGQLCRKAGCAQYAHSQPDRMPFSVQAESRFFAHAHPRL